MGGSGRVLVSVRQYAADLAAGLDSFLDLVVVAVDGNCMTALGRRKQVEAAVQDRYAGRLVVAVPDPHVELWYLADPRALPQVLGEDFRADVPAHKCERRRYKDALREACRNAGVEPISDGVEYGEEVASVMDLDLACRNDTSLSRFVDDFRAAVRSIST